jgi:hypothetical protein
MKRTLLDSVAAVSVAAAAFTSPASLAQVPAWTCAGSVNQSPPFTIE